MTIQSVGLLDAIKTPSNPFPGLRPFESNESHLFFGRDEQIGKLLAKFSQTRFLAVVGTSGSGKSSLVRAGLIPALRSGMLPNARGKWRIAVMRPSNDPMGNLGRALNAPEVFGSAEPGNVAIQQAITEATLRLGSQGLIEVAHQNLMAGDENLLVLVDQFEELFRFLREARKTGNHQAENDAADFVKLLLESVKDEANIYVIITMRSDFLGDCSQFWDLPEAINESQYLVPRLTRTQLREVIEGPVAIGGGEIAPQLVNQLLNDIADDQDQLPILQHALMRTWDEWRQPNHKHESSPEVIDVCCYTEIGGMASALSKHAYEAFEKDLPDDRHRQIAERMFKALTEKGEDNREIRRPVEFGKLCAVTGASEEELKTVIEAFRESGRSFLMPPVGTKLDETKLVDISHESLIRVWTKLQQWTNEEADSSSIYLRLADAAHRKAELWRGKDLQEAEDWLDKNNPTEAWAKRYDTNFTAAMKFLSDSQQQRQEEQEHAERQQCEKTEQAERELAQAQALAEAQQKRAEEKTRSASKSRRLAIGLAVLGLLAAIGGVIAFTQYQSAESNLIQSRSLLYIANQLLAWDAYDQKRFFRVYDSLEDSFPRLGASKKEDMRSFDWYYLWRQMHNEKQTLRGHTSTVSSVVFSPDGRMLASGSFDYSLRLWNVGNKKELRVLNGHTSVVTSVAFSLNSQILASGSWDNTVRLWDVASGAELHKLEGHKGTVNAIAFSPDGRTLASASSDNTLKLWDVVSGKELRSLERHIFPVTSVAFSPNGRMLASGGWDHILLLDVESWKELRKLGGKISLVSRVVFSPDGRTLASVGYDDALTLWNVDSGKELRKLKGHTETVNAMAFSPNGQILASASNDQTLRLWDVVSGKETRKLEGHADAISSVAFSPDGRTLVSASSDDTLKLWDVEVREDLCKLEGHLGPVNSVMFSPDGRTMASGSDDKTVRLWDVNSGKELRSLVGHTDSVRSVAFSPDGQILASGSSDKTIRLWDVATGKELHKLERHTGTINAVAFSPDGQILVSGSSDKTAILWSVESGKELQELNGYDDEIRSIAFSPDQQMLASANDGVLQLIWVMRDSKKLQKLKWLGLSFSVTFSPDGRTLASGSYQSVTLLDVKNLWNRRELKRHSGTVKSMSFSPDGRTLVSSSDDKTLRLWDVASGKELHSLAGHTASVNSVAFSPDGRTLASGSQDKTILLWRGATDEEVAQQCNRCGRKD